MARGKVRCRGAAGRSEGVRPVLEPVLARKSGEGGGEKSRSGRGANGPVKPSSSSWGVARSKARGRHRGLYAMHLGAENVVPSRLTERRKPETR